MRQISLALLGFGNVGQAFCNLIEKKRDYLRENHQLELILTGIQTAHHGTAINSAGLNLTRALEIMNNGQDLQLVSERHAENMSVLEFIYASSSDFFLECTPLNPFDGQPALSYLKTALKVGKHVITANKGPLVYGYQQLKDLARDHDHAFYFESAVMDGAPIFSLFREALPAIEIRSVNGILNSCTNYLLDLLSAGLPFADAIKQAQAIGITETDSSFDIDGWDAAIKLAAISTVLLDIPLLPTQIQRTGIREITPTMITEAVQAGEKWKLVCSLKRNGKTILSATVKPERVSNNSPYFNINGTSSFVQFETDVLPALGILEGNPGPETTAYGMLSDLLNILKRYKR